jgi:peptide/nickel transport system ATP-binding protein
MNIKYENEKLLEIKSLKKFYTVDKGFFKRKVGELRAVDGFSACINKGETLGLVGESGCGKSTIGKCLLKAEEPTGGEVLFNFDGKGMLDILKLTRQELKELGFRKITHMVFQDPKASLDPRKTVMDIISEPYIVNKLGTKKEMTERVYRLMEQIGLDPKYLKRYPHAFSGGQRQRISIARALITEPHFIVADEPTAALDVSVQAQILNLMKDLQKEYRLTYLFISHNLGVIRYMCDRVAVMYLGKMVEGGKNDDVFTKPLHPYTEALLKSVPVANPNVSSGIYAIAGEIGDPMNPPSGCYFHPRCRYADQKCRDESPELKEICSGHYCSCHYAGKLNLKGIGEEFEVNLPLPRL